MAKSFKTAADFRISLEQRLKQSAALRGLPLASLRLKVVIERLLARLFVTPAMPWLLKGGYAMELRYRPRARTTKDIDLSVTSAAGELAARLAHIRDELQAAADNDMSDYFVFQIGSPSSELQGAPGGGARFPVNALLAGRSFGRFHIDVGFGDPAISAPEELIGQDFLAFAGVPPAKALAIPKAQQFAEKLHAYTPLGMIDRIRGSKTSSIWYSLSRPMRQMVTLWPMQFERRSTPGELIRPLRSSLAHRSRGHQSLERWQERLDCHRIPLKPDFGFWKTFLTNCAVIYCRHEICCWQQTDTAVFIT